MRLVLPSQGASALLVHAQGAAVISAVAQELLNDVRVTGDEAAAQAR